MENEITYKVLQRLIYPITMVLSVVLFFVLIHADDKLLLATTVPILFSLGIIILFEKFMPYSQSWKPGKPDLVNDGLYLLLIQTVLPKILVWLAALFILRFIKANNLAILHIWPHHLPIWAQEIMVILISDFFRYWLHPLSHTLPFLWRLHAVHHSVDKLYWM